MAKIADQFGHALQVPEGKAEIQEFDDELPASPILEALALPVAQFLSLVSNCEGDD